ncbi:MAG TPA: hypothetical protein VHQ95_02870 [Pyrinomonadaceae bacterium]|jgi:hypothetical protein|nr:hypothetical protein [Pyrinomonadaceae bacterium]
MCVVLAFLIPAALGLTSVAAPVVSTRLLREPGEIVTDVQMVPDEKSSRTAAQKKIDSQLLYALKQKRGETRGVPTERINIELDQKGRALVDITARVSPQVSSQIRKLGGVVISEEPQYHTIRARLALEKLEALAGRNDVSFIGPAAQSMNNRINTQVRPN